MPYRALIQQSISEDINRRRANPGVQNFGELIRTAMAMRAGEKQEARQEGAAARNTARTAVYNRYPQLAAKDLGMDAAALPATTGVTQPPGTSLSQVTYDEYGNPQTTFKSNKVSESDLAEMYNRTILEVDKQNALNAILPKYKPIPKPTFDEWKKERGFNIINAVPDDAFLASLGVSEEDINYTLQQHPETTREQLIAALRANTQ